MSEIIPLLICLESQLSTTIIRQLGHVIFAMLCVPNRATMLNLSRWSEKGGSYRTFQRLYHFPINWLLVQWTWLQTYLLNPNGTYILAGDEVVVSKAGKKTHGIGRFYSGLAQRVIPSVSFMALSLIVVEQGQSYPLHVMQLLPSDKPKQEQLAKPKRIRGRPKGSKNHVKPVPILSSTLSLLQDMLEKVRGNIASLNVKHVVLDGKFGNYPSTWMLLQLGYHIISKMRCDAALYLPYDGPKPARGSIPRYGEKLDYEHLPQTNLINEQLTDDHLVKTYHLSVYHKDYSDKLNVVVITKTHLKTGKFGNIVLFTTDLDLSAAQIEDYYRLRFQIEFNFRDAKQHFGLEDFMNIKPTAVTNAVNLAFLMVNITHVLLQNRRIDNPDFSILDLKAQFRARRYLDETIKLLPETPEPDLISRIWRRLTQFGSIRTRTHPKSAA